MNRYSYTLNNPLKYIDPNGKLALPFHIVNTFINSLLRGNNLYETSVYTYNDIMVDIRDLINPKQAIMASNANMNNMIGQLPNGQFQLVDQAKTAVYNKGMEMLANRQYGELSHLINDRRHNLQSMKDYGASFWNKAIHFLGIDINPIYVVESVINNIKFTLDPLGTFNNLFNPTTLQQQNTSTSGLQSTQPSDRNGFDQFYQGYYEIRFFDYNSFLGD